jgi:hypothetical protein
MATRSRDIFVSYARQDIDVAAQLAKLLENKVLRSGGTSVYWREGVIAVKSPNGLITQKKLW